jgi:mono/diheme cytochrome c family protein
MEGYVGAAFRWPDDVAAAFKRPETASDAMRSTTKSTTVTKVVPHDVFVRVVSFGARFPVAVVALVLLVIAAVPTPAAAQLAARATRPQVTPPQGPVRKVIFARCVTCHGIDDYAYSALDRAGWDAHLTAKHQALNVALPQEERALLLDWLAERFGPTSKPFPRTYVAREVTTFFTDGEAEALVKRACTTCHSIERVNGARFSPDRWRVVTLDMRERGAKLEDQEVERLVEWLGRTKGTNDSDRQ